MKYYNMLIYILYFSLFSLYKDFINIIHEQIYKNNSIFDMSDD